MSIKIKDLSYAYLKNRTETISSLNLDINDREIVLILGLNGSGKTTLIKNIAGLLKPSSGEIFVNNQDIFKISIKERSKLIAYVSQKTNALEDVIIEDYLTFGFVSDLKFYERPKKEHLDKVHRYAEKFNITSLLKKPIDEVSGGERQIVSICSALLQNTSAILLDEPTSALDLKNQNIVLNILKEIATEENKTIVLSSHNPNHALYLNSSVVLLKNGKIINQGKASDVIVPDVLKEVYGDNICYSKDLSRKEIGFK